MVAAYRLPSHLGNCGDGVAIILHFSNIFFYKTQKEFIENVYDTLRTQKKTDEINMAVSSAYNHVQHCRIEQ